MALRHQRRCPQGEHRGVTEEASIRPAKGGNCANWVVGHLLVSRMYLLAFLDKEWIFPEAAKLEYQRGSSGDSDGFLSWDDLLRLWSETQLLLMEALGSLAPEKLHEEVPALGDFSKPDTRERRIAFLHFHESYHLGQLGLLRRLLGKDGAIT